jgi:heat shock protein HtpX
MPRPRPRRPRARHTGSMRAPLFPHDTGLAVRMVLAAVVTPLAVLAALAAVVAVAPLKIDVLVAIAAVIGIFMTLNDRARARSARKGLRDAPPELAATVERLCLAGDLPKPEVVVNAERQPNSWVTWLGRGHYRLHVTAGLIDLLTPAELEAVVAHELAHVAHRDAAVMTVVGGPGAVLLHGGSKITNWPFIMGGLTAMAVGWLGSLGGRILSRYREFAADAGAVALTGNPVALASALAKVSDGLVAIPSRDLRSVAARDAFHLLPVVPRGEYNLPATHPPLRARIERLQRMEAKLQSARPAPLR